MPFATRPTPDQLLRMAQAEEEYKRRGRLKIFLGYASGVGKSYRMLDEGRRRRERGQDVVVGAIQPQTSPDLDEFLRHLEIIPPHYLNDIPVMDVDAVLRRRPQVCLVDGLAHKNPPGSKHANRWEDVEQLLESGISVLTTINLQYVEERREQVEQIRGKGVAVTVPERFLRQADEIVVVDAPAEFCLERNGAVDLGATPVERQHKLSQLREIALLLAADVVDRQLEAYLEQQGLGQSWGTQERILVCITPKGNPGRMLERARLLRDRFHGELFAVYVGEHELSAGDQTALERNLGIARAAGAKVQLLDGENPAVTILDYARRQGVTQIFIGHSLIESWRARLTRTTADRLIRGAEGIDVKLFPH
jgi:two-component system, OmpR family, sensor histidine kinase KdpD